MGIKQRGKRYGITGSEYKGDDHKYKTTIARGNRRVPVVMVRSPFTKKMKTEHRVKAEIAMGRVLRNNEIVHHIDLNTANNRNNNLLVCSKEYHSSLHHVYERVYAKKMLGGKCDLWV